MIKFFRKIRQNLLEEGKTSKYLKYAIGEIVLVVIGILIALQINNWNEERKSKNLEISYLKNLKEDVKSDSLYFERSWFTNVGKKIEGLTKAKNYYLDGIVPLDTISFINDISYGGIYGIGTITPNSRTYKELVSTGNISLITNQDIREQIVDYYLNIDFLSSYASNLQSGYPHFINSYKVYNPKSRDNINSDEIPILLKKMRKDEFYELTNRELTYVYSTLSRLERLKKESSLLYHKIEEYLKNKNSN
ncbi:hypothetical protein DZC72_10375 [Maribacter algicola]|uniref:Uncharacterized protein n=1 Tax=Maribacter algicola TaxID=2498892 RepID=A0A426RGN7_9FLAO|nr:DUF6090 family protein [Maribacter algicola]RRQ48124.1 hypothetical protein DZC72_10375 [Maribacter algicola]